MRWATTFHHATEGLGPDLETNQFPSWGESQRDKALDGMAYFDSVLKQLSCVAGDLFSMVDITLFAGLGYHDFVKIDIPAELDSLTTWRERIAQRPSIAG